MKNTRWLGLIALVLFPLISTHAQAPGTPVPNSPEQAPATASASVSISPGAAEVVRLAESGVGEDVILAFIQNSKSTFSLSADDVLYLKDVGLTSPVITAMLNHDKSTGAQTQPPAEIPQTPAAPPVSEPTAPPQPAPAPSYVSNPPVEVNYFYNDLSPYGSWVVLEGYGWCWQPRAVVINRGWRPYCDGGHWIYSDAGWYWASDYSWGWAPFHYGRWYLHDRCGWVWMPDRIWAPAWVTWRVAGDSCGWAPLPPRAIFEAGVGWRFNGFSVGVNFDFGLHFDHFTFVALGDFCNHDVRRHSLPVTQVKNIYNQTTIVNNTTVVNKTTIVNRGVAVERVSAASHTEIRKATIRDLPTGSDKQVRTRGSDKNEAVVYRPQLTAPAKSEKIVAQKLDERRPVIQHTRIAPTTVERQSQPGNRGPTSVSTPQRSQPEVPNAPQRSKVERSPTVPQTQPAPRTYQPAPAAPSSPVPSRSPEERKQPTRSSTIEKPDAQPRSQPSQSPDAAPRNEGQRNSSRQSQQYYPKGFSQSSESRSPSRSSERQDAPSSRSGKDKDRPN